LHFLFRLLGGDLLHHQGKFSTGLFQDPTLGDFTLGDFQQSGLEGLVPVSVCVCVCVCVCDCECLYGGDGMKNCVTSNRAASRALFLLVCVCVCVCVCVIVSVYMEEMG
jgi:hypothetical protein